MPPEPPLIPPCSRAIHDSSLPELFEESSILSNSTSMHSRRYNRHSSAALARPHTPKNRFPSRAPSRANAGPFSCTCSRAAAPPAPAPAPPALPAAGVPARLGSRLPKPNNPRFAAALTGTEVGDCSPEAVGEVNEVDAAGSMSRLVRKDESERPEAVEVLARKTSSRWFWSARRTPCEISVQALDGQEKVTVEV